MVEQEDTNRSGVSRFGTQGNCGNKTGDGRESPALADPQGTAQQCELLDVKRTAKLMSCSERTVWRLSDSGKMPAPVRIGRLVRWQQRRLAAWLDQGCPAARTFRSNGGGKIRM